MGRVIAVANQKGGVAKTTTAVNLGIGLAREGKRVLLVDTDPQGSLTASLGYVEPNEIPITLANILTAVINEEEVNSSRGILHHEEDIDIMPGNIELSALEVAIGSNAINLRACFHIKKQTEYGNLYDHCCVSYRFREHGISESQNSGKRIQKF